nr:lysozyme inhibitor LprI family protein [Marivita sp. S6314]
MAGAQTLTVDPDRVRACFEATEVGALYPPCLGQAAGQCQDQPGGSTTVGMADCIAAETAEWDAILNEEYKATQAMNAAQDAEGRSSILDRTEALRDAQRAWIAFRDADCAARYAIWQDGTIRTIVGANCHLTMTASRAVQLRDMRGF